MLNGFKSLYRKIPCAPNSDESGERTLCECISTVAGGSFHDVYRTKELIEYMEGIGEHIALAVQNALMYSKLKKVTDEVEAMRKLLTICAKCKKIRDDEG